MPNKNDLRAVRELLLAEDRRRLGAPPSNDQILAYSRGELSGEEEARVRELLACYPELANVLAVPFGDEDDALPAGIVNRQWRAFRARHDGTGSWPRVWQTTTALAAALALTFGALLWQTRNELTAPRAIAAEQILHPNVTRGVRGGGGTVLSATAGNVILVASLHEHPPFPRYRVDVVEVRGSRRRPHWSTPVTQTDNDVVRILLPGGSLEPGEYEVVVRGIDGTRSQDLARYTVRVAG